MSAEDSRAVAPTAAIVAGVVAVATGVVRLAYEDFYRALGTTLDTVGLSNQRLVTLGAGCVLILLGSSVIVAVPARVLWGDGDDAARRVAAALSATASAAVLYAAFDAAPVWGALAAAAAGLAACLLPMTAGVGVAPRRPVEHAARTCAGAAVLVGILAAHGLLAGAADHGRAFAADGRKEPSGSALLLDIAAVPVCVVRPDGQPLPGLPPDQLLLGKADGAYVLLRPGPGARAVSVPVAGAVVAGRSGADCAVDGPPADTAREPPSGPTGY